MGGRFAPRLQMKRFWPLLMTVVLSGGCRDHVTAQDVYGRWEMGDGEAAQILVLHVNATFEHSRGSDGAPIASGNWELIGARRAPRVLLKYRRDFDEKRSTSSLNVIRRWNGRLSLATDSERRLVFEARHSPGE
jgi:hypothetical protein